MKIRSDDQRPTPKSTAFGLLKSTAAAVSLSGGHKVAPIANTPREHSEGSDLDEDLADDGLTSSSSEGEFEDALAGDDEELTSAGEMDHLNDAMYNTTVDVQGPRASDTQGATHLTPTPGRKDAKRQSSLPGYFEKPEHHHRDSNDSSLTLGSMTESPSGVVTPHGGRRRIFRRRKSEKTGETSERAGKKKRSKDFNFDANQGKETLGIVIMEVKGAEDLPRLKSCKLTISSNPRVNISSPLDIRYGPVRGHFVWEKSV